MSLAPVSQLILRSSHRLGGRVLLLNPPGDELGPTLARAPEVEHVHLQTLFQFDHRALSSRTGDALTLGFGTDLPEDARFDQAVVFLAREKARTRLLLHLARSRLTSGGRLWLVGENRAGIKSSGRVLDEFAGSVERMDAARHCVLFGAVAGDATVSFELAGYRRRFEVGIAGESLTVTSYPGVFSHGELDPATGMLLEHLEPRGPLLDFGCGCGVIAAWAAARDGSLEGVAADADALALAAARETLAAHGDRFQVVACDGFQGIEGRFAQVVSNPPFHRGVSTEYRTTEGFIRDLPRHLLDRGEVVLVANAFLDYPQRIEAALGACEVLASDRRFRVYRGRQRR